MRIRLDLINYSKEGITKHPLTFIKDLGIEYEFVEPVPIGDCWLIGGATGNIPKEYSNILEVLND